MVNDVVMKSFVYIMSNCSNFLNSSCLSIHLKLEAEVYVGWLGTSWPPEMTIQFYLTPIL